ncbi:helix-turn-helix transcriptional regulator [Nesterenkonia halotolerans]|uniref:helix-turn-helix transcriptional regulator n=1 Tax=Nesterenkonia halotolerans TaxID=225325 RepID=UPI003EE42822
MSMSNVMQIAEVAVKHPADPLLKDTQVQELTGIPAGTLRWWRHHGDYGPKWFRLGPRAIRYKTSDVTAWIEVNYNESPAA